MRPTPLHLILPLAARCAPICAPICAAICAAICAPASAAPQAAGQEGMIVVRDPQTGQMRAPSAAELQALRQAAPAAKAAPLRPRMVVGPDGRRHVRLGESGHVYSVVERRAEGKLDRHCVHGEVAAERAVHGAPATVPHQEHRHESR